MPTKMCLYCGKPFHHKYASQINSSYCSITCSNKARSKTPVTLECPICGTSFIQKQNKKFCSKQCVGKAKSLTKKPPKPRRYPDMSQYEAVSKYMRDHNPMHNPTAVEKNKAYRKAHPDVIQRSLQAATQGKQRLGRTNPSKLEFKLRNYLDELGIEYEPSAIIKTNFIVDIRIGTLIIEADGDYWHGHPRFEPLTDRQIAQQKRDASRNKYLTTCGYTVIRIWESDMSLELVTKILRQYGII